MRLLLGVIGLGRACQLFEYDCTYTSHELVLNEDCKTNSYPLNNIDNFHINPVDAVNNATINANTDCHLQTGSEDEQLFNFGHSDCGVTISEDLYKIKYEFRLQYVQTDLISLPEAYSQSFSCTIPKVVGITSQLGGDSASGSQISTSVEVSDTGDVEMDVLTVNGLQILIPKQSETTQLVNNQTVTTSNEVDETDTVAVQIQNTVSFEFDIQPEYFLTALFDAGEGATQEEYIGAMETELCQIAENGLEAAISETEVFDCVLAILENEITVDFNTPLEDQFPDLSSSRFTTYANQFRQRREDNTDYNDGIRARLDVSVQSVELTTNDAGSIADVLNTKEEEIAATMTQVAWEDIASQSDQLQNVALITYDSKDDFEGQSKTVTRTDKQTVDIVVPISSTTPTPRPWSTTSAACCLSPDCYLRGMFAVFVAANAIPEMLPTWEC